MTDELLKRYRNLLLIKKELTDLNDAIDDLYQLGDATSNKTHSQHYTNLKDELIEEKSMPHYQLYNMSYSKIADNILGLDEKDLPNIYIYEGTYWQNGEQTAKVSYDSSNARYRLYGNIENPSIKKRIPVTLQEQFQEDNFVLYAPKDIEDAKFYEEMRELYFKTIAHEEKDKVLEVILKESIKGQY